MLDEIWVVNCSEGLIGKLYLGKQVQVRSTELSEAYNACYFGRSAQISLVYLPTKRQLSTCMYIKRAASPRGYSLAGIQNTAYSNCACLLVARLRSKL